MGGPGPRSWAWLPQCSPHSTACHIMQLELLGAAPPTTTVTSIYIWPLIDQQPRHKPPCAIANTQPAQTKTPIASRDSSTISYPAHTRLLKTYHGPPLAQNHGLDIAATRQSRARRTRKHQLVGICREVKLPVEPAQVRARLFPPAELCREPSQSSALPAPATTPFLHSSCGPGAAQLSASRAPAQSSLCRQGLARCRRWRIDLAG